MHEFKLDGHEYQIKKLGLSDGKDVLTKLMKGGVEDMLASREQLDWLQGKLFGANCCVLSDQDEWVPLGKNLTDSHFAGRTDEYMTLLMECFRYNFADFLAGGWATSLLGGKIEAE